MTPARPDTEDEPTVMDAEPWTAPSARRFFAVASVMLLLTLAILTNRIAGLSHRSLEYPLWGALLGLAAQSVLGRARLKARLSVAFRTELYLKIGLVLLGTKIDLRQFLSVGVRGVVQAVVLVTLAFFFTWWLGSRLKLDRRVRAIMSAAIAVCGVSAAIAAAVAIRAEKAHLAYVTALVIVTALPMMVLMPYIGKATGMSPEWAGAWFGGSINTTAAVVAAGTIYHDTAVEIASIVKMSQSALIGIVAFLLTLYWVLAVERKPNERPSAWVIWDRFPKFVLGFTLAVALASVGVFKGPELVHLGAAGKWAFALAFIGIGWELSFRDFRGMGLRPVSVYLGASVVHVLLALGLSWILFA